MPESEQNPLDVTPATDETVRTSVRSEDPAPVPAPAPSPGLTRAPRFRTMVFGLILLVIAVCVLVAQLTNAHLDAGAVALTVMVIAGLLLVAGGRRNSG